MRYGCHDTTSKILSGPLRFTVPFVYNIYAPSASQTLVSINDRTYSTKGCEHPEARKEHQPYFHCRHRSRAESNCGRRCRPIFLFPPFPCSAGQINRYWPFNRPHRTLTSTFKMRFAGQERPQHTRDDNLEPSSKENEEAPLSPNYDIILDFYPRESRTPTPPSAHPKQQNHQKEGRATAAAKNPHRID